jgi:hypothetical protein
LGRRGPVVRGAAAAAALATAWLVIPTAVPLYDGVGFPDEPYRYVVAPSGSAHTPAASTAKATVDVQGGLNASTVYAYSAEQAPQVSVVLPGGMVATSADARSLTVTARPQAPDVQPVKGHVDGNVYAVSAATTPVGTARWAPAAGDAAQTATVTMRATTAKKPAPVFLYRPAAGQPWRTAGGYAVGNDIYSTQFAGFGDYALAFGVTGTAGHKGNATAFWISGALAVVLLAAAVLLTVRLTRRRSAAE